MDVNAHMVNRIHPTAQIDAESIQIGCGVTIGAGVVIKARRVVIGDFVYIGDGSKFFVPELTVGDYSRINDMALGIGTKPMLLGRNLYIGRGVRLDSRGGLRIDDNVGIGDSSQLWTHIRHGDVVQGCRWDREYPLHIEHDVWLVAKVTVGGCERIGARTMVFNESNVTRRELPRDTTWAGNPAVNVTEKMGKQFADFDDDQKRAALAGELARFYEAYPQYAGALDGVFDAVTRTYHKSCTAEEVAFLRFTLAKFVPRGED